MSICADRTFYLRGFYVAAATAVVLSLSACGGGAAETTPTPNGENVGATPRPLLTASAEPVATPTPVVDLGSTPTPVPVFTPTPAPALTLAPGPVVTATPKPAVTPTPVVSPTAGPVFTPTPEPTFTPTATPTSEPTFTPTPEPTFTPTATPTSEPTFTPTPEPTFTPTPAPTFTPSPTPSPVSSPGAQPCLLLHSLCEGFEQAANGDLAPSGWTAAGNVMLSNERVFSGAQSLKVVARGANYNRNTISLDLASMADLQTEHYGRLMLWVDDPGSNGGDFTFVQAEGKPQAGSGAPADTSVMYRYRVEGRSTQGTLMANYDTWIDANNDGQTDWLTDCERSSAQVLPRETWSCLEWHFDTSNNQLEYWLNGQPVGDISVLGSGGQCVNEQTQSGLWLAPERFDRLHIGLEQYHSTAPARQAFIDDVILSGSPIGCANTPAATPTPQITPSPVSTPNPEPSPEPSPEPTLMPSPEPTQTIQPTPSPVPTSMPGGGEQGPGVLFNMNFEGESIDSVPNGWFSFVGYVPNGNNNRGSGNYALVDNERAHSGSQSLKVEGNGPAQIVKRLPADAGRTFMRAWFYMSRSLGNDASDNHEHLMGVKSYEGGDVSSSFSANSEARIGQGKGHLGFNVVPDSDAISPPLDQWYSGPSTPEDAWFCVEAELNPLSLSGGYDTMLMYVDGQEVNAVRSASDWHVDSVGAGWLANKLGYVMFGWHSFSSHTVEMWVDDIVVSTQPIGCN